MKLNSNGTNSEIKAKILPDSEMRKIGFTDYSKDRWFYSRKIFTDVTFNLAIPKDGSDISIDILDENFLQPYDYQMILERNPNHEMALRCQTRVERIMDYLRVSGVISGHKRGEYI